MKLKYRGYTAEVTYSTEDQIFIGTVVGITDVVGFHTNDHLEVTGAFHSAIDDYTAFCLERGIEPCE